MTDADHPVLLHTVLDAEDVRGLAEFYRELLGLVYRPGDEPELDRTEAQDWLVLTEADGTRRLAFQQVERRIAPPGPTTRSRSSCTST